MDRRGRTALRFILSGCWGGGPTLRFPALTTLLYAGIGSAAFTRASDTVFTDHEGLLHQVTINNEATFTGVRRLHNLFPSSSGPNTQDVALGIGVYMLQVAGDATVSAISSANTATITGGGSAVPGTPNIFTVTSYGSVTITIVNRSSITGIVLHNITGESDQTTEREFIQSDVTYDGLGVAGVRYFNTAIDGTALATGKGFSRQGASTNKIAGAYNAVGPDMLSAELITNEADRTFSGDTGFWLTDPETTITGGEVVFAAASGAALFHYEATELGKIYRITYTIKTLTAGTIYVRLGNTGNGTTRNAVGTYTEDITCSGTTTLTFYATALTATLDDVSLKEVGAAKRDGTFVTGLGTGTIAKRVAVATWYNPIPGIVGSGGTDGQSYIQVVSDIAKISSAKLIRLIPSGKVYKAVAGATASMDITLAGNLSPSSHAVWLYARGDSAAADAIALGDATAGMGAPVPLTNEYQLIQRVYTAGIGGTKYTIPAGDTVYLCLMQSELGVTPTAPITVEGAAVSRASGDLVIPIADGTNFSQAAGTATVEFTAGFDSSVTPNNSIIPILSTNTKTLNLLYIRRSVVGDLSIGTYDGTTYFTSNTLSEFSSGDTITFTVTWAKQKSLMNNKASTDAWGATAAYDGAFQLGSYWEVGYNTSYPFSLKNIAVNGSYDKAGL